VLGTGTKRVVVLGDHGKASQCRVKMTGWCGAQMEVATTGVGR
jgi:hypothetical protein